MVTGTMTSALDDIRYLSDSAHRIVTIEALAEGPRSRAALREATGASSATVSRLLGSFEDRGWVSREGPEYALTRLGEFVAREFTRFHDSMRTARDLRALLPWMPIEEMGIDIADLTDASITQPTDDNPMAVVSRYRELERRSVHSKSVAYFFPEPCVDARHGAILGGTQTFEAVLTPSVVDGALSTCPARFEEIVAADRATLFVYDGDLPHLVSINDGVACYIVMDGQNGSVGIIESDDPNFLAWVEETFDAYREESTPLTTEELSRRRDHEVAQA